jgi:hypothetical protein
VGIRERINASLTEVRARGQRLVQLNLELLKAELKAKGQKYGAAIAMFVVAGLLSLYALGFALATIVVAIHLALPLWLSMLIVTLALFLVIAILLLAGRGSLRKAKSPAPERAIAEAKTTADAFKTGLRDAGQSVRPKPKPLTQAEQFAADAKAAEAKWPGAAAPAASATPDKPAAQTPTSPAAPATPDKPAAQTTPPVAETPPAAETPPETEEAKD